MASTALHERARWWSYGRQRLGRQEPDSGRALRDVVGVYSAHPTGPLSLHARVRSFDGDSFRRLENERTVLRLPAMRTSIHIVPRQTAHLVFWATHKPMSQQRWRIRDAGISEDEYTRLRSEILQAARRPKTARELREDLSGTEMSLRPVVQTMTMEGTLLRVGAESLTSKASRRQRPRRATAWTCCRSGTATRWATPRTAAGASCTPTCNSASIPQRGTAWAWCW
jgi:hypothetical protein